jgi:hypothetical protein
VWAGRWWDVLTTVPRRRTPGAVSTCDVTAAAAFAPRLNGLDEAASRRRAVYARALVLAWVTLLTAIVIGPMARRGWVLSLDWVTGPRMVLSDHIFAGEHLPAGPLFFTVAALLHGLGGAAVGWSVPALCLVVAGLGAARLGGPTLVGRMGAAVAYLWNPFVHERLYAGQVALLAGYALLPLVAASALGLPRGSAVDGSDVVTGVRSWAQRPELRRAVVTGSWWAAATACSVHLLVMGGLVVAACWLADLGRHARRASLQAALTVGTAAVLVAPWLLPMRAAAPSAGDARTVAAFATRADPELGLALGTLGQRGFWRPSPGEPGSGLGPWWTVVVVATVAVVAVGVAVLWRQGDRANAGALVVWTAVGWVGSWGTRGPLRDLYRFALDHVSGFAVMREPGKLIALVSLGTAMGFGHGAAALAGRGRAAPRTLRAMATAVVVAFPVLLTPGLAWGVGGRLEARRYPAAWEQARAVIEAGPDRAVAVLPWDAYLDPGFSGDRVVRNPGGVFFAHAMVSDDAEVPGLGATVSSDEVERALAQPDGAVALADRGIGWVVAIRPPSPGAIADDRVVAVANFGDVTVYRNEVVAEASTGR